MKVLILKAIKKIVLMYLDSSPVFIPNSDKNGLVQIIVIKIDQLISAIKTENK